MKNVQIIDGADNCTYSIFEFTDAEFFTVFPLPRQNIEFIEDLVERLGDEKVHLLLTPAWSRILAKSKACGIHGTIFFQLPFKKQFYPTKIEEEMINPFTGRS